MDVSLENRPDNEHLSRDQSVGEEGNMDHSTALEPGELVDETSALRSLQAEVRDQDDLERDIGRQADRLLIDQADERDNKRLEKTGKDKEKLLSQLRSLNNRLHQPLSTIATSRLEAEVEKVKEKIQELDTDIEQISERIEKRHENDDTREQDTGASTGRLPNESYRDFLIRTGKITPFSQVGTRSLLQSSSNLGDVLLEAEEEPQGEPESGAPVSHQHLLRPGFADEESEVSTVDEPPRKKRRIRDGQRTGSQSPERLDIETPVSSAGDSDVALEPEVDDYGQVQGEDSEEESGAGFEDDFMPDTEPTKKAPRARTTGREDDIEDLRDVDDGDENKFQRRLQNWVSRRSQARERAHKSTKRAGLEDNVIEDEGMEDEADADQEEWYRPHPKVEDLEFDGPFRLPGDIYPVLFDYQKTGVQWLWELYCQHVGGIIGDEMGLGKTIQTIAFLAGLHYSKQLKKPIIIVCPATVMKQWVNEFHKWWPPFRVSILHTSGSGMIDVKRESKREDDMVEEQIWDPNHEPLTSGQKAAKKILKRVVEEGHVLVTTYSGLQSYSGLLIPVAWEYAVLDEGHKIRNPNTAITICCKELQTHNRIILSGTPMQNNLTELWSLFDFIFPMRLGTLVNFRNQFEIPIRIGGYANASNLQVQTAMRCAEALKDAISPYLLQRFKIDVAADLPKKSEQVLFCRLTKVQRKAYEIFLDSNDMKSILAGKRQVLFGIDILRKICNHPDLQDHKLLSHKVNYDYGAGGKSGKMQVVKTLLELWRDTGHKALLFAQHRIMLDILEKFIRTLPGMQHRRMDGNTPITMRQVMVDDFNTNPDIHVFLLTTKVGGLGVNLTGADRVIIYDPDWNPSTDLQARERAWRLGQKREVGIYRLMTAGTIEEKIYHRQIFKQFLTNKVLKDPKQRQTFHMNDLYDLFTLGGENEGPSETSSIFKTAEVNINKSSIEKSRDNSRRKYPASEPPPPYVPLGEKPPSSSTLPTRDAKPPPSETNKSIENLPGIASVETFQPAVDEESTSANPPTTTSQGGTGTGGEPSENRLLSNIFSSPALHSSLSHDSIVNPNGPRQKPRLNPEAVAAEASRAAATASQHLDRAAVAARSVPIGTPTWTGQVGVAGRPTETTASRAFSSLSSSSSFSYPSSAASRRGVGNNGPSSSSILANLASSTTSPAASNNNNNNNNTNTNNSTPPSSRPGTPNLAQTAPKGNDFIPLIVQYIKAHGGKVHTQMLIDHFNRFCTSPARTAEFKDCLKKVAELERPAPSLLSLSGGGGGRRAAAGRGVRGVNGAGAAPSGGRGRWALKDEYR